VAILNPAHKPLLDIRGLSLSFRTRQSAIDRVSFSIDRGRTLGLVGASGAGKSSIARAIMRLIVPDSGEILFMGQNICSMGTAQLMAVRQRMQIVFQNPSASLSPRRTVAQSLLEPLQHFSIGQATERLQKVNDILQTVGLHKDVLQRYPHQFSSGQQQRIAIARALITEPDLLIADEAVASLDVSVQAQVLQLFQQLIRERGITLLFISHDLAVIRQIADEVAVMYRGQLVEQAPADTFFSRPCHPYSQALLGFADYHAKVKTLTAPDRRRLADNAKNKSQACVYAATCTDRFAVCEQAEPPYYELRDKIGHTACPQYVKCHLYKPEAENCHDS